MTYGPPKRISDTKSEKSIVASPLPRLLSYVQFKKRQVLFSYISDATYSQHHAYKYRGGNYVAQPVAEHAKRVADLLQLFMAKGLVQKDGDTVIVRTVVIPPDELA